MQAESSAAIGGSEKYKLWHFFCEAYTAAPQHRWTLAGCPSSYLTPQ
jgi:hypothetical protein